jgi:hypothetical protein
VKACWVANPDGPFFPDWDKLKRHGVGRIYFAARHFTNGAWVDNDKQINSDYRQTVNAQGFVYGIFRDPHWDSISDPGLLASLANDDLIRAGIRTSGVAPYMFDIEYHDAHFVAETIRLWRRLRPTRLTAWTLEPNQGGWFTDELVSRINGDPNLVVVPQNFYGDMTPFDTPSAVNLKTNLINRGVLKGRVKVFYDGSKLLPTDWDGCILSEERLP